MSVFAGLDPRRICVIKPSALGDVVQALSVLGPLRQRFPSATVSWVVNRGLATLLEGHSRLDEVIPFERRGGIGDAVGLLRKLRARKFDLVIDLQGLLRTSLMTRATGAPVRVGLQTSREGAGRSCTAIIEGTGRDVPARQRYMRIVEELFRDEPQATAIKALQTSGPEIPLTAADRAHAAGLLRNTPRPLLALCPGAKWETKRWPAERFAELAVRAHREYAAAAVILGGPDESALCLDLEERLGGLIPPSAVTNLAGTTTVRQLAAVLEACTWAVTNDSGPMHLADAVGTPVLGVFTCTSPWLSGPPLDKHELLSTRTFCAAGYHKSCPMSGAKRHACHNELDVDRAWAGFIRLAAKSRRVAA
jgi:lipopolysaccharide heptosyltransferase II